MFFTKMLFITSIISILKCQVILNTHVRIQRLGDHFAGLMASLHPLLTTWTGSNCLLITMLMTLINSGRTTSSPFLTAILQPLTTTVNIIFEGYIIWGVHKTCFVHVWLSKKYLFIQQKNVYFILLNYDYQIYIFHKGLFFDTC